MVLHSLLPTLNENPLSVESLRVYLILSELLRATVEPNQVTDIELPVAVAAAILRLHPNKLQILGEVIVNRPKMVYSHDGYEESSLFSVLNVH